MANGGSRLSPTFFMGAALLVLVCGFLLFYRLGEQVVDQEAEARVLLTASEMNRLDTWLVPTIGGEGRWEKPPLYVWAVKLASWFNDGEVSPTVARVPAALSMALLVLLGAWWAYVHLARYPRADRVEITPEIFGLLTGLMLVTSPQIFKFARDGVADPLFALFCFASLYCLGESFEMRRSFYAGRPWRHWVIAGYLFVGLAVMTKGPVAFLFVFLPYIATCLTYKMRRPDWVHFPAAILALVLGSWWFITAMVMDSAAAAIFYEELFGNRFGSGAESNGPIYFYVELAFVRFFPWIVLAGVMAYRNLRHIERTPSQVLWAWCLVIGVVWLSLVGSKKDEYFLPVAPFVLLLAGDALARWDFDTKFGTLMRVLIRSTRWVIIAFAIPVSLIFGSELGLTLAIALTLFSLWFAFHRRRSQYSYAIWERTVHWTVLLVVVFIGFEAVYVRDYLPRERVLSSSRGFISQVENHHPDTADLYYYGTKDSAVYSYHMGRMLEIRHDVDELLQLDSPNVYLLSDNDVPQLMRHPNLATVVTKLGGSRMRPRATLFKVVPNVAEGEAPGWIERYASIPPLRIAVFGDSGRGDSDSQAEVAARAYREHERKPFHEAVILGDSFPGSSRLERIHFHRMFERPFHGLLRRGGVPFHGVLGEKDQNIVLVVTNYPVFQMAGKRYYARDFRAGLVRFYALDAYGLDEEEIDGPQWTWLEEDLAETRAPWKIVALHRPILTLSTDDKNDASPADPLLDLFDRYEVDLVLSAAEPWYQLVEDPDHHPVFVGTGWSGRSTLPPIRDDRRLQMDYGEKTGFVSLEITPEEIRITAINVDGLRIQQWLIQAPVLIEVAREND